MAKEYIRNTWINDQAPPLNATNLNNVEEGTIVNSRQDLAVVKNITVNAHYPLTAEENQYGNIKITDTGTVLTTARNIIMNGNEHTFIFNNATAQDLTVANSGGTGITVGAGRVKHLRNDSVNVIEFEGNPAYRFIIDFGTVSANNRYVESFPDLGFTTNAKDWDVKAEIYGGGEWFTVLGGTGNYSNNYGFGAFSMTEGLVIQTADNALTTTAVGADLLQPHSIGEITTAPCRAIATYIGVTNG